MEGLLFHKRMLVSVWILLLTLHLVASGTWVKCYENDCSPCALYDDEEMKTTDKSQCSCTSNGQGSEGDCYEDENEKVTCYELTMFKSKGQVLIKGCGDRQPRSKPMEVGCKPVPGLGPDAEKCVCAEPLCNTKFKNDWPKRQ